LALGDTVPFGSISFRLPEGARLTEITEIDGSFPGEAPPGSPDSTFVPRIETADDVCTIVRSDEGGGAALVRSIQSLGGTVERRTIRTLFDEVHRATVGRTEPGQYGATAHVVFDLPRGPILDISCGRLETADALFAGVST
jgi:hypothetical protein